MKREWWHSLTVYQIYTRSFCDSNGDGIGDFGGILQKLDYLQELGVGAIWLSPFNDSPNYDNGYDVSDYYKVMEEAGTMEELEELIAACEKREIVVMMDLVLNHSSHLHPWFLEARKDRNSKYHDFYIWKEGTKEQPPEGGGAFFGGSTWEWVPEVQEYYYHSFSVMQPDLNWKNPSLRKELYRMIQFWMDKGIRGFRLDAIDNIVKDGHGGNDTHSKQIHTYLMEMNQNTYGKSEQILTVGETGGATVEMAQQYSDPESQELSMIFQFELMGIDGIRSGNWDPKPYTLQQLKQIFEKWQTGLEEKGWNSLFWGNHDFPRVVSRFGNDREPYREKSAKMLAVLLHGMKGTPYIYQGEEIGMTNVSGLRIEDYQDIESVNFAEDRKKEGWEEEKIRTYLARNSRDHARTPMQWNAEKHAGFTAGTPWMAENQNYEEINVENSRKNPDSLFYFYQKLIALRRKNDTLVYGDFRLIEEENPDIFA
ncbi:MAG: alpha-glucosidase, partial [Blautia sp.]